MMRALALASAAVLVAGCSLLSSPEPVQLYRFGDLDAPTAAAPGAGRTVVVLNPIDFPDGAAGDRLVSSNGNQIAYLGGARWVAPAQQLFTSALEAEFQRGGRSISLSSRREAPSAGVALDLDISTFEARYVNGIEAAPTVIVSGRARIVAPDRTVQAERSFQVEQPAAENRVSAVVAAFDAACADLNRQIVAWVGASAG